MAFLDGSNVQGSGVFYDGDNISEDVLIGNGVMTLPLISMAASAIVTIQRTLVNPLTDRTSLARYLPFVPVSGDILEFPPYWLGSAITVNSNGTYVITPGLPDGTTIPRRAYDVSAGVWYEDEVTFYDGTGGAVVEFSLPSLQMSASVGIGYPTQEVVGSMTLPLLQLVGIVAPHTETTGVFTLPLLQMVGIMEVFSGTVLSSPTTEYAAFTHGLNVVPETGDVIEMPTLWLGSEITVDPDGHGVISPGLPNGTEIPRRFFDASEGTWYQDFFTVNNGSGSAVLGLPILQIEASAYVILPVNAGLRITDIYAPNSMELVANVSDITAVVYDVVGGNELWQGTVTITNGDTIIDTDDLGAINNTVFLVLRWVTGNDEIVYAATETVINLDV